MNPDYTTLQKKVEENAQEISFLKEKIAFWEEKNTSLASTLPTKSIKKKSVQKSLVFFFLDIVIVLIFLAMALGATALIIEESRTDSITAIFMFVVFFPITGVIAGILGMKTSKSIKNFFSKE